MQFRGENTVFYGIRLLKRCGGGAYGDVYYGEDASRRRIAVKIIDKVRLGDTWKRELKGVVNYRKITDDFPELLKIFYVGEDEETFFYTMEAADSRETATYHPDTLEERLRGGAFPPEELLPVATTIFQGIKTLHKAGFSHRDIKPANILFINGRPKLGDIGLTASNATMLTQVAGTMDFLPPEIRSGGGDDLADGGSCRKNDFYAFGKVIYCIATGKSSDQWPLMPAVSEMTYSQKLFLQLAMQLCDRDSVRRLDDVQKIDREISVIEKNLLRGETFSGRFRFYCRRAGTAFYSNVIHFFRWFRRHWLVGICIALLLAGGIVKSVYFATPEIPATAKKKLYHSSLGHFTIELPSDWMSAEEFREKVQKIPKEQRNVSALVLYEYALPNTEELFCGDWLIKGKFATELPFILIMRVSDSRTTEIYERYLREDKANVGIHTGDGDIADKNARIRQMVDGEPGFYIMGEFGQNAGFTNYAYIFRHSGHWYTISLAEPNASFPKRMKELMQMVDSLKFDKDF